MNDDAPIDDLLEYLHRTRGFDFAGYKRPSLERRIRKRMAAVPIDSYEAYVDYLEVHPEEFPQLFNTVLINVTGFFRDPESWELLRDEALPPLLAKRGDAPFRVWSAGCASGEEAYTTMMILAELLGEAEACRRAKVYATDVDDEALQQARQAVYAPRDLEALPPTYVDKYFERTRSRYEFKKELRRCVIFGRHDLIHDAPISRIDLLTCRNTIMYLNAETQSKIVLRLHFALTNGGILMLGKAEMLLSHANLFTPLDLKRRVFVKVPREEATRERLPIRLARSGEDPVTVVASHVRLREQAFDATPTAQIVVDMDNTVSLVNARARELFGISTRDLGQRLQDHEVSYRPVDLRSALEQAYAEGRAVTLKDVERARPASDSFFFDVQVAPLKDRNGTMLGAQISFVDVTQSTRLHQELRHANHELEAAYEELQSTSEELETTNEELQSTVEELETTNEELQSTNEELETMNEELQSSNEELQTLNDELRQRGEELGRLNVFLGTILATLRAAVIVLDRELHVQVWNREAEELWGLRADEVRGKNFMGLDIGLPVADLRASIRAVFAGEPMPDVMLEATNRRGRTIQIGVAFSRLVGDSDARGVLLMIEEQKGNGGAATTSDS